MTSNRMWWRCVDLVIEGWSFSRLCPFSDRVVTVFRNWSVKRLILGDFDEAKWARVLVLTPRCLSFGDLSFGDLSLTLATWAMATWALATWALATWALTTWALTWALATWALTWALATWADRGWCSSRGNVARDVSFFVVVCPKLPPSGELGCMLTGWRDLFPRTQEWSTR